MDLADIKKVPNYQPRLTSFSTALSEMRYFVHLLTIFIVANLSSLWTLWIS